MKVFRESFTLRFLSFLLSLSFILPQAFVAKVHAETTDNPGDIGHFTNELEALIAAKQKDPAIQKTQLAIEEGATAIESGDFSKLDPNRTDFFLLGDQYLEIGSQRYSLSQFNANLPIVSYNSLEPQLTDDGTFSIAAIKSGKVVARHIVGKLKVTQFAQDEEQIVFVDKQGNLGTIDRHLLLKVSLFKTPVPVFQQIATNVTKHVKNLDHLKISFRSPGMRPWAEIDSDSGRHKEVILPTDENGQHIIKSGDIVISEENGEARYLHGIFSRSVVQEKIGMGNAMLTWLSTLANLKMNGMDKQKFADAVINQSQGHALPTLGDLDTPVRRALEAFSPEQIAGFVNHAKSNTELAKRNFDAVTLTDWQNQYEEIRNRAREQLNNKHDINGSRLSREDQNKYQAALASGDFTTVWRTVVGEKERIHMMDKVKKSFITLGGIAGLGAGAYYGIQSLKDGYLADALKNGAPNLYNHAINGVNWLYSFWPGEVLSNEVYRMPLLYSSIALMGVIPLAMGVSWIAGMIRKDNLSTWQRILVAGMRVYAWGILPIQHALIDTCLKQKSFFPVLKQGFNPFKKVKADSAIGRKIGLEKDLRLGVENPLKSQNDKDRYEAAKAQDAQRVASNLARVIDSLKAQDDAEIAQMTERARNSKGALAIPYIREDLEKTRQKRAQAIVDADPELKAKTKEQLKEESFTDYAQKRRDKSNALTALIKTKGLAIRMADLLAIMVVSERENVDPATLLMYMSGDVKAEKLNELFKDPKLENEWFHLSSELSDEFTKMENFAQYDDLTSINPSDLVSFYQLARAKSREINERSGFNSSVSKLKNRFNAFVQRRKKPLVEWAASFGKYEHEFLKTVVPTELITRQVTWEFIFDHIIVVGYPALWGGRADMKKLGTPRESDLSADPHGSLLNLWTPSPRTYDVMTNVLAHFLTAGAAKTLVFYKNPPVVDESYLPFETASGQIASRDAKGGIREKVESFWRANVEGIKALHPARSDIGGVYMRGFIRRLGTIQFSILMALVFRMMIGGADLEMATRGFLYSWIAGLWYYGWPWDMIFCAIEGEEEKLHSFSNEFTAAKEKIAQGIRLKDDALLGQGYESLFALLQKNPKFKESAAKEVDSESLEIFTKDPDGQNAIQAIVNYAKALQSKENKDENIAQAKEALRALYEGELPDDVIKEIFRSSGQELLEYAIQNPPSATKANPNYSKFLTWVAAISTTIMAVPMSVKSFHPEELTNGYIASWAAISVALYTGFNAFLSAKGYAKLQSKFAWIRNLFSKKSNSDSNSSDQSNTPGAASANCEEPLVNTKEPDKK